MWGHDVLVQHFAALVVLVLSDHAVLVAPSVLAVPFAPVGLVALVVLVVLVVLVARVLSHIGRVGVVGSPTAAVTSILLADSAQVATLVDAPMAYHVEFHVSSHGYFRVEIDVANHDAVPDVETAEQTVSRLQN